MYVSVKQVAERYAVCSKTVWMWARTGNLPPPVKLSPGCTRWKLSDIEAFELRAAEVA